MGYSGAGGELIHEKNQKQKNLVTLSLEVGKNFLNVHMLLEEFSSQG